MCIWIHNQSPLYLWMEEWTPCRVPRGCVWRECGYVCLELMGTAARSPLWTSCLCAEWRTASEAPPDLFHVPVKSWKGPLTCEDARYIPSSRAVPAPVQLTPISARLHAEDPFQRVGLAPGNTAAGPAVLVVDTRWHHRWGINLLSS